MLPDIPQSLAELAKAVVPRPVSDFSELVSLKLFGKSLAKLRAEAENVGEEVKQKGEIQREVNRPFIVEIESSKAYRQYSNLGITLQKATKEIKAPAKPMGDDNDVFWGLLEHSKEISNEEMQNLIAKIIAGEYNNPGMYSMSTLQILKSLSKKEIELFERVCGLLVSGGGEEGQLPKMLFSGDENVNDLMKESGLHFGHLQTLQSLGLFLPNDMTINIPNPTKLQYPVSYFGENLLFECENENTNIKVPNYFGLSLAGQQILEHISPKKNNLYLAWLKKHYSISNYKVTN